MGIGTPRCHLPVPQPARQWGRTLDGMELLPYIIHVAPARLQGGLPKQERGVIPLSSLLTLLAVSNSTKAGKNRRRKTAKSPCSDCLGNIGEVAPGCSQSSHGAGMALYQFMAEPKLL